MREKHPTIEVLSEYQGAKEVVSFRCKTCGNEWATTPDNVVNQGAGCPRCASSYGEQAIAAYLIGKNIAFDQWVKFDGLVGMGGGMLSYDFHLPAYNILIEYQGQFHDESVDSEFFHNDLEKQRTHDRLKREYADSHQIRLLEIWYYDFKKINRILDAELAS